MCSLQVWNKHWTTGNSPPQQLGKLGQKSLMGHSTGALSGVENKSVVTVLVKFSRKLNESNWAEKHGVCNFWLSMRWGAENKIYKARRLQMGRKHLLKIWCEEMAQHSPPWACGRGSWNTRFRTEYLHLSPKLCHVHSDVQGKTCWILDKDKTIREWSNCNAKGMYFVFCLFIAFCLKSSWSSTC